MTIDPRRLLAASAAGLLALVCGLAGANARRQEVSAGPDSAYRFRQIRPGIYSALGTGTLNVGSNSAVIVNQDDVLIVDSHITPEAARVMMREIRSLTDKPVRFLINTHFHYDHTNGNQIFAPAADIIGHEFTRRKLLDDPLHKGIFATSLASLPRQLDDLKTRAAAAPDAGTKAALERQLRVQAAYAEQVKEVRPVAPNLIVSDQMTLFRGDREIRLLFLGRGHTGGDLVVYLPKERVLCSGDLIVNGIANLVDGYVNEWPDALEKLKPLDFEDVIPGHGEPFKGKETIDYFQAYLRDLWQQARRLHDEKVPAADAAKRIDMSAHAGHYHLANPVGVNPVAVSRMYEVIEGRADR